jgi:hypothetical protein
MKWAKLLPSNFKLKWSNTWDKQCSKKEVGFIWTIWNKPIVVNMWKPIVDGSINKSYLLCEFCNESILHRFWECKQAQWAQGYAQEMMNGLINGTRRPTQRITPLHWKHYVFVTIVGQDDSPTLLEYGL